MKRSGAPVVAVVAGMAVVGGGAYAFWPRASPGPAAAVPATVAPARGDAPAERLELRELLEPGPALQLSARAVALTGKRVRMAGFMADMELPPRGAFYLVPRPLHCDESGGGIGDLPLESVLVKVPSAAGETVPFRDGALEVTGILEIGNRAGEDGRVSAIRLLLDDLPPSNAKEKP